MSDPVTNLDIEDVLSSIRRLVAEGDRAVAEPRIIAQPKAESADLSAQNQVVKSVKAAQERFVLTPALRVAEQEEVLSAAPRPEPPEPVVEAVSAVPELAAVDSSDVELPEDAEAAPELQETDVTEIVAETVAVTTADIETDTVTNWPSMPDNVVAAPARNTTQDPEAWQEPAAIEPEMQQSDENRALEDARARLEAKIAELEAVVGPEATQWPGSAPLVDITGADISEVVQAFEEVDEIASESPEAEDVAAPETENSAASETVEAEATNDAVWADIEAELPDVKPELEAVQAAAEADGSTLAGQTAQDEASAAVAAALMLGGQPAVSTQQDTATEAPAATEALAQAEPDDDIDWGAEVEPGEEAVLDEEALRRIVSEIVREELQGALGERITRNVRKLVRREIYRALAAENME
ncbi:MAG: hypothetical protein JKX69_06930 [Rhodobacteraceae bacterium]|nr:hypothetical protein [Paracoccaceae bacterium]